MRPGRIALAVALSAAAIPSGVRADVEPIVVCAHASITGAAPISRSPQRFGQVYFDAINAEQGGIDGRAVRFLAFDDGGNPTGARAAIERCRQESPVLVVGFGDRRSTYSSLRLAADEEFPYLTTVHADAWLEPDVCCSSLSVGDEAMMRHLWGSLIESGDAPVTGMLSVADIAYDAGRDAFADAAAGALVIDRTAQADERSFGDVWTEMRLNDVQVVNAFITPTMLINFLAQRPAGFSPAIIAPGLGLGRHVVAQAAPSDTQLLVLSDAAPAWREPWIDGPVTPWDDAIQEHHRVFAIYAEEQSPPIDDIDWTFFIRAQQIARFLDALDGAFDPASVRAALGSYEESASTAFPSCALSLGHGEAGAHELQGLHLANHRLTQSVACDLDVSLDLLPPTLSCEAPPLAGEVTCTVSDLGSGVTYVALHSSIVAVPAPVGEDRYLDCVGHAEERFEIPRGVRIVRVEAEDCSGWRTSIDLVTAAI
jgi:hypothetical protein